MARILTRKLEELKQPFVIENRAGAGGSIAGTAVARAAPDGYTVLLATGSLLAINVSLYKNLGYDPEKDFEPISLIGTQTNVLYLHPAVPAKSFAELVAHAKANPGKLSFGSGGNGTPAHSPASCSRSRPSSTSPMCRSAAPGRPCRASSAGMCRWRSIRRRRCCRTSRAERSGRWRSPRSRTAVLPEVLTIAESGFPGFEATTWHALVVPAGTPKDVVAALHRATVATLNDPAVRKALTDLGIDVVGGTPEELRAYLKSEIPKWAEVVKASGAKVD